jgi:hypothetical protein
MLVDAEDTLSGFSKRKAEAVKGYKELVEGAIGAGDNLVPKAGFEPG